MVECIMAGCSRKGIPNYLCSDCGARAVFCCEGCETELLNDLRGLGMVAVACVQCGAPVDPTEEEMKTKILSRGPLGDLLKRAEAFRERLIEERKYEESVIVRDLAAIARTAYPGHEKK